MKHIEYTKRKASSLEWRGERGKQAIYCTIWDKRGRLLSEGGNSYKKTHPRQARVAEREGKEHKQFLHAECNAILSLVRKRKEKEAYLLCVVRVNKEGGERLAKPCVVCQSLIDEVGIKNVCFSL